MSEYNKMLMKHIQNLGLWAIFILPTVALGGSESTVASNQSLSDNVPISDIVLVVTLIAGLLTIISVARGKSSKKNNEDDDFVTLKNEIRAEYKELETKISELTKIDAASKINDLQESLTALDDTVNNSVKKKIYTLSEHFTMLESRVLDLDKHFDQSNNDRKEETRQIKSEINTLRENIREDINDVKDIIMKLMMALKTDDD
jgi:hypothetical protein